MERVNANLRAFILMLSMLLAIAVPNSALASAKDGELKLYEGESKTLSISSGYWSTFNKATNISFKWTAINDSYVSISNKTKTSCTIRGLKEGTTRVYYFCSYDLNGFYRTMDFYYEITVLGKNVYVTSITVSPSSCSLTVGESRTLSYQLYPTNATNKTVSWRSSNTSVATVSNGYVVAKSSGSATIYCEACDGSGKYGTCNVTVSKKDIPVYSIRLDNKSVTLEEGTGYTVTAYVSPSDATNKSLRWESYDTSVATVSSSGYIYGVSAGQTKIRCSALDGSGCYAECDVIVLTKNIPVTDIWLDKSSVSMGVGESLTLTAKLSPSDASNSKITWSYSDKSIISVKEDNNKTTITAIKSGKTTVTATSHNGKSSSCAIEIVDSSYKDYEDLYIFGEVSGWDFLDDFKMVTKDYDTYTLGLKDLEGAFFIASPTFSQNYGAMIDVELGETYTLQEIGGILRVNKAFKDINLTFIRSSKSFKVSKDVSSESVASSLKDLYQKGAQNQSELTVDFNLTVTHVDAPYCFVKDDYGTSGLIYSYRTLQYKENDIIPGGWKGEFSPYMGLPEIVPVEGLPESIDIGNFTPNTYMLSDVNLDMVNEVVWIKDVVFDEKTPADKSSFYGYSTDGATKLVFRNQLLTQSVHAGTYKVKGAVSIYGSTLQVYPIEYRLCSNDIDSDDFIFVIRSCNNYDLSDGSQKLYARTEGGEKTYQGFVDFPTGAQYFHFATELNNPASQYWFTDKWHDNVLEYENGVTIQSFPEGSIDKDGTSSLGWSGFTGKDVFMIVNIEKGSLIMKIGDLLAVDDVFIDPTTDEAEPEYFNLQGIRVENPKSGVYIRKIGGNIQKVMIR